MENHGNNSTKHERTLGWQKWSAKVPLIVLFLSFLVYLPGTQAGFVWDDHLLIEANENIDSLAKIPQMFERDLWEGTPAFRDKGSGYYRPLMTMSLAIDHALFGFNPVGYHFHSLIWHLLCVFLFGRLLKRHLKSQAALLIAMALFAFHPLQVEAVIFISSRNDLMAGAGLLAMLLFLERDDLRAKHLFLGGACLFLAALCKESVLLAPLILALFAWSRTGKFGSKKAHLIVAAAIGAYFMLRFMAEVGSPRNANLSLALIAGPKSLSLYAERILWPVNLLPGAHLNWFENPPWGALVLVFLGFGFSMWLRKQKAALGWGLVILTLGPAIWGIAHTGSVADRYMYLPMAGIGITIAIVMERARWKPQWISGIILTFICAGLSANQVPMWKSDRVLFGAAVDAWQNPHVYGMYAKIIEQEGRLDEAAHWYRQAVSNPKPYPHSCWNITRIHLLRGSPDEAVRDGKEAIKRGCPKSPELISPLSLALAFTGKWDEAVKMANSINEDPTGQLILVKVAYGAKKRDMTPFETAIKSNPNGNKAALKEQVAYILRQSGETESADWLLQQN